MIGDCEALQILDQHFYQELTLYGKYKSQNCQRKGGSHEVEYEKNQLTIFEMLENGEGQIDGPIDTEEVLRILIEERTILDTAIKRS